jgi:serine/threonine protein kinase
MPSRLLDIRAEANCHCRDIKPENILFESIPMKPSKTPKPTLPGEEDKLDEGDFIPDVGGGGIGSVALGDFGLSKIIAGVPTATPCGTMSYAAPEIVRDEKYTTGVDMWAIGCVLYTLLAGYPPFYDPDTKVLMKKVAKGQYTFDSPWWNDISNDAKDIVSRLLTVNTAERLNIEEFLAHPWITQPGKTENSKEAKSTPQKAHNTNGDTKNAKTPELPATEAVRESRVEARTPGFMNVRELFDVVFSAHRNGQNESRKESPEAKFIAATERRESSDESIHDKLDIENSKLLQKRDTRKKEQRPNSRVMNV